MIPQEVKEKITDFIDKNAFVMIMFFLLIFIGYCSVLFLGKNNVIEIEVEKVIEKETGVKVDLTPS